MHNNAMHTDENSAALHSPPVMAGVGQTVIKEAVAGFGVE
jgi:hypothetical protein